MNKRFATLLIGAFLSVYISTIAFTAQAQNKAAKPRYNVLFIAVDDLRPELNCYGASYIKSPNIDRLAKNGVLFNRAYCQQALCGPTRASLLSGLRPDSVKVYDLTSTVRAFVPNVVTLPEYFKKQGYFTASFGKIYHVDDPQSWSVPAWFSKKPLYASEESLKQSIISNGRKYGPILESADVPDNAYADGDAAENAIRMMNEVKDKPFFLAVGFYRPHLPFVAPKKYWDLYDRSTIKLPAITQPPAVPAIAQLGVGTGELSQYAGVPKSKIFTHEQALSFIHGYYASVSYTDAQVGKVLNELKRLGLDKNTIVILWGDHGWKLGEYSLWGKRDNMETDQHAPLIVSLPQMSSRGKKANALVEFVDIYPTLCDAAGLPIPAGLQGQSFTKLLRKPETSFKPAIFSQNIRPGGVMGYSMRTNRYRYTEWHKNGQLVPDAIELYDEQADPHETTNLYKAGGHEQELAQMQSLFAKYGKNGFKLPAVK